MYQIHWTKSLSAEETPEHMEMVGRRLLAAMTSLTPSGFFFASLAFVK